MKTLIKENTRGVDVGNSAFRVPKMKEGDTYSSPPGIIDQCRVQSKAAEKYGKEHSNGKH